MVINIDRNKVVVKKSNLIFVLVDYGTLENLQNWVSAWVEAEMRYNG